jgi:hypothetical protein
VRPEISQAETARSRVEMLDREQDGGRFVVVINNEVRQSAIALQSALREHEGRAAEGTGKPRA